MSPSVSVNEVQVTSSASVIPVLKRMDVNPIIRIRFFIPRSAKGIAFRKINCVLNEGGLKNIDHLKVYFTGEEPLFSPKNQIADLTSFKFLFSIPITIELKAGLNYVWLSCTLKEAAEIKDKINLICNSVETTQNQTINIREENKHEGNRIGEAIRKAGDDNVNTYRIPGITSTSTGSLIAVYDIRYNNSKDLPENIDVGMSRSKDGGQTWEPMKTIMDMGAPHQNNGIGDPSILFDPVTNKIWTAALWSKGNHSIAGSIGGLSPDSTGQFVLVNSADDGNTWSDPINITAQVKDPAWKIFFQGPGNGIAMKNGTLVFPAQYWDNKNMPYSTIIFSNDHGLTWQRGTGAKSNTTESTVVETTPGTLMLNMRDNRGNFRTVASTNDMGKTWVEQPSSYSALKDPVCMGSLLKTVINLNGTFKEVLFFSNPDNSDARSNITIKASLDSGKTWLPSNQVLIDERKCFGYSSLTKIDDETIGILYEGVRDLYFVKIPVAAIIK